MPVDPKKLVRAKPEFADAWRQHGYRSLSAFCADADLNRRTAQRILDGELVTLRALTKFSRTIGREVDEVLDEHSKESANRSLVKVNLTDDWIYPFEDFGWYSYYGDKYIKKLEMVMLKPATGSDLIKLISDCGCEYSNLGSQSDIEVSSVWHLDSNLESRSTAFIENLTHVNQQVASLAGRPKSVATRKSLGAIIEDLEMASELDLSLKLLSSSNRAHVLAGKVRSYLFADYESFDIPPVQFCIVNVPIFVITSTVNVGGGVLVKTVASVEELQAEEGADELPFPDLPN